MHSEIPIVSIIIVSYNTKDLLGKCVETVIKKCALLKYEIIVVDNGSSDGSVEKIKTDYPKICIIENKKNIGFGPANNIGAQNALGKYLLLLNSDALLTDNSLIDIINCLESQPQIDVAAPRLVNEQLAVQKSAIPEFTLINQILVLSGIAKLINKISCKFYSEYSINYYAFPQTPKIVSGACFLIKSELFKKVGGFDELFFFTVEEVDLFKRIYINNNIKYFPWWVVIHIGGNSSKKIGGFSLFNMLKGYLIFNIKWGSITKSFIVTNLFLLRIFIKYLFSPASYRDVFKYLVMNFTEIISLLNKARDIKKNANYKRNI